MPLESSVDDCRLQLETPRFQTFCFLFSLLFIDFSRCHIGQDVTCWPNFGYIHVFETKGCAEKPSCSGRMELIVVHLFWLCYPQVSLGPVRLCPSSTLESRGFISRLLWGEQAPGDSCKEPASFSDRAGDLNRHLVGAPGEARVKRKEIHVAILSIAKHFWWDCIMSKERPKRNIIQKKYVSKTVFAPKCYSSLLVSPRWKCINFHRGLWRLPSGSFTIKCELLSACQQWEFKGAALVYSSISPHVSRYVNTGCFSLASTRFPRAIVGCNVSPGLCFGDCGWKDVVRRSQKTGLLFAVLLFRAAKTSLSAIARRIRLPFRPMLSVSSRLVTELLGGLAWPNGGVFLHKNVCLVYVLGENVCVSSP